MKLLLTLLLPITLLGKQLPKTDPSYHNFSKQYDNVQFSPENFKKALEDAGLPKKHINDIFSHAKRESGNFKSTIFKKQNNAFGMRLPKKRQTLALAKQRGYAIYNTWYDSIFDYWLWYKNKPITQNQSWGAYLRSRNYMNSKDKKL
jgi:hypothetical protein